MGCGAVLGAEPWLQECSHSCHSFCWCSAQVAAARTGRSLQQDGGPGVPAIPRWPQHWVTGTGWETWQWLEDEAGSSSEGHAAKRAQGAGCLRLSVFMGDKEWHSGRERCGFCPTGLPARRDGMCLKRGSSPVCNSGNAGCLLAAGRGKCPKQKWPLRSSKPEEFRHPSQHPWVQAPGPGQSPGSCPQTQQR